MHASTAGLAAFIACLSVLPLAAASPVIPVEDLDDWRVERFCGNPGNRGFVQGDRAETGSPGMMAFDSQGNAYVACGTFIEQIARDGKVRLVAGTPGITGHNDGPPAQATFGGACDVALADDATLYVIDGLNFTLRRLRKRDNLWHTETLAGQPGKQGHQDGQGTGVLFTAPFDSITMGPKGVVYLMDGDWLRRFENGAVVTLNAGRGRRDGPLAQAQFDRIMGAGHCLAWDGASNIYVADRWNMAIRKIDLDKNDVSTFAGRLPGAETGPAPRDGPVFDARFHAGGGPCTAFFNRKLGYLLVISADEGGMRRVHDGYIKTFGPLGSRSAPFTGNARQAAGGGPCGIDADGNVYIFGGDCIRVMKKTGGKSNE